MNRHERERALYFAITTALEEDPDLLKVALEAVTVGMRKAVERANTRRSEHWCAMTAALTLADPKRMTAATKEWVNKLLVDKLKAGDNGTEFEKKEIERRSA